MAGRSAPGNLKIHEEHALALIESPDDGGDGIFNADGTVNVVILRPCEGRGPGERIYTRELCEATAGMWSGYASYLNHEDPRAKKALGKLRRGPEELAGELRETVWDPDFTHPDDERYGYQQGAVVGKFMPANDLVEGLLKRIPGQLKLSINAMATSLKPKQRSDGKRGWLVEGIQDDPEKSSVDLVTAHGAGGRVLSLIESVYGDDHESSATDGLADLSDEQLREYLREHRPHLSLGATVPIDITQLREALETDEGKALLAEIAPAAPAATVDPAKLQEAVSAELEKERNRLTESIRTEVREELGKSVRARSLHTEALRLIEATRLPESAKAILRDEYAVDESDDGETVTAVKALALIEAVEDEGKITKTAKQVLAEEIDKRAKQLRNVLREAAPTNSYAPGGADPGDGAVTGTFGGENSAWAQRVKARGMNPKDFGATVPAAS